MSMAVSVWLKSHAGYRLWWHFQGCAQTKDTDQAPLLGLQVTHFMQCAKTTTTKKSAGT